MKITKITALISAAMLCFGTAAACKDKDSKKSSSSSQSESQPTLSENLSDTIDQSVSGDNYDKSVYYDTVMQRVDGDEDSSEPFEFGKIGELVEPDESVPEEADLGSYHLSDDGVKLYYKEDEFPDELVLTLKEYFQAFSRSDYTAYTQCVYPSYIEEMNKYLEEDFDHDLKTSFASQCASLADNVNGDFIVTRIKVEPAPQFEEGKDNIESYFSMLDDSFNKDYYSEVKAEADKFYDALFYVMVQDAYGDESLIISEYEIVFAEKDGRYYLFG